MVLSCPNQLRSSYSRQRRLRRPKVYGEDPIWEEEQQEAIWQAEADADAEEEAAAAETEEPSSKRTTPVAQKLEEHVCMWYVTPFTPLLMQRCIN